MEGGRYLGTSEPGFAFATANGLSDPNAEYFVPNWPATPNGRQWREVTRDRNAPNAGREPIFPWEAKVYALF